MSASGRSTSEGAPSEPGRVDTVWTIPNALSLLRVLLVPVFLYLLLGPEQDLVAIFVLMSSGFTDYLDGKLARAWGQTSRVGELLDPVADRLYILATLVAFVIRDIIPWWLAAILVARDVILAAVVPVLTWAGSGPLPVHFLGKAATFNLLYAFPLLLLGDGTGAWATLADVFGWAFVIWGSGLYVFAGLLYLGQAQRIVRSARTAGPRRTGSAHSA